MSDDQKHLSSQNNSYVLTEWTRTKKIKVIASSLQELKKLAQTLFNYPVASKMKVFLEEDGKFEYLINLFNKSLISYC